MFGLRMPELLLILLILVVLFGATKLPALGQGLGEGLKSFKRAFRDSKDEDERAALPDHAKTPQASTTSSSTPSTK
jgi:sec-independent protein translocase protein TatA